MSIPRSCSLGFPFGTVNGTGTRFLQNERSSDIAESANVSSRKLPNLDAGPDGSPFLRETTDERMCNQVKGQRESHLAC